MLKKRSLIPRCLLGIALLGVVSSAVASPPTPAGGETGGNVKTSAGTTPAASPTLADTSAADAAKALAEKKRHMSFLERLDIDLREQLGTPCYVAPPDTPTVPASKDGSAAATAPVQRRGLPAPFDSPPYPTGEWQIGGTSIIGDPGIVAPGFVMQTLYDGPGGDAIKASRIQFGGLRSAWQPCRTEPVRGLPGASAR